MKIYFVICSLIRTFAADLSEKELKVVDEERQHEESVPRE